MKYAILRTQKLKASAAVFRSLKHAFREQETPNADPARLSKNTHIGCSSAAGAMRSFRNLLPEKFRKDAVQCIEYLFTASPEAMSAKAPKEQDAYFEDARRWLIEKHGAENVFYAGIHRDETTPHMYAYVVPKVGEKLNCRAFLGGAKELSKMQTDFYEKVGKPHGLERGIERSKARHTTIREYYHRVNTPLPENKGVKTPEPSLSDRLNIGDYGQRVAQSVLTQITPRWNAIAAALPELEAAKKQVEALKKRTGNAEKANQQELRKLKSKNQELETDNHDLKEKNRRLTAAIAPILDLAQKDPQAAKRILGSARNEAMARGGRDVRDDGASL